MIFRKSSKKKKEAKESALASNNNNNNNLDLLPRPKKKRFFANMLKGICNPHHVVDQVSYDEDGSGYYYDHDSPPRVVSVSAAAARDASNHTTTASSLASGSVVGKHDEVKLNTKTRVDKSKEDPSSMENESDAKKNAENSDINNDSNPKSASETNVESQSKNLAVNTHKDMQKKSSVWIWCLFAAVMMFCAKLMITTTTTTSTTMPLLDFVKETVTERPRTTASLSTTANNTSYSQVSSISTATLGNFSENIQKEEDDEDDTEKVHNQSSLTESDHVDKEQEDVHPLVASAITTENDEPITETETETEEREQEQEEGREAKVEEIESSPDLSLPQQEENNEVEEEKDDDEEEEIAVEEEEEIADKDESTNNDDEYDDTVQSIQEGSFDHVVSDDLSENYNDDSNGGDDKPSGHDSAVISMEPDDKGASLAQQVAAAATTTTKSVLEEDPVETHTMTSENLVSEADNDDVSEIEDAEIGASVAENFGIERDILTVDSPEKDTESNIDEEIPLLEDTLSEGESAEEPQQQEETSVLAEEEEDDEDVDDVDRSAPSSHVTHDTAPVAAKVDELFEYDEDDTTQFESDIDGTPEQAPEDQDDSVVEELDAGTAAPEQEEIFEELLAHDQVESLTESHVEVEVGADKETEAREMSLDIGKEEPAEIEEDKLKREEHGSLHDEALKAESYEEELQQDGGLEAETSEEEVQQDDNEPESDDTLQESRLPEVEQEDHSDKENDESFEDTSTAPLLEEDITGTESQESEKEGESDVLTAEPETTSVDSSEAKEENTQDIVPDRSHGIFKLDDATRLLNSVPAVAAFASMVLVGFVLLVVRGGSHRGGSGASKSMTARAGENTGSDPSQPNGSKAGLSRKERKKLKKKERKRSKNKASAPNPAAS